MANEKKPSIYVDRGTIGSSDELDEYGVWVKSEPQDLASIGIETRETPDAFSDVFEDNSGSEDLDLEIPDIEALPDFESSREEDSMEDTSEEDLFDDSGEISDDALIDDDFELPEMDDEESDDSLSIDESADFDDLAEQGADDSSAESEEDEGLTEISMDDFIAPLDIDQESDIAEEPVSEQAAGDEDFTDESDMVEMSGGKTPDEDSLLGKSGPDLSTKLLMKIAEELSSIRTELSNLKKDFSSVKPATPPPVEEAEEDFFGEEDDEKIALTGDELNNILNTADFTEEAGADATIELSDDLGIQEEESTDDAEAGFVPIDLDMDMDISLEETDLDELEAEYSGESAAEDAIPDFSIDETEELKQIRESGAEPMTSAPDPEDTEYLADDPLVTEESIDLSDAVIDEPDLSSDIQDNPIEEPSLEDISIDLDLEDISMSEDTSTDDDGTLDLESDDDMELTMDIPEPDFGDEEISVSPDTENLEDGGDLSLIPEGFVEEADEIDSTETISGEDETISVDDIDTFITGTEDSSEEIVEAGGIDEIEELGNIEDIGDIADIEDAEEVQVQPDEDSTVIEEETLVPEIAEVTPAEPSAEIPSQLKKELRTVLSYMDQLLESLPDEKIEEFAQSQHYDTYKKLFKELGLV